MLLIKYTEPTSARDEETGQQDTRDHYTTVENEEALADFYAADPESFIGTPKVLAELTLEEAAELSSHLDDYFDAVSDAESTAAFLEREAGARL